MAYAFDSLGYAKRLRDAGIPQPQAEAHAEAARDFAMAELVTKSDLAASVDGLKSELRSEVALIRSDMALIRSEMDKQGLKLTIRLGAMLVVAVGALAALVKLA